MECHHGSTVSMDVMIRECDDRQIVQPLNIEVSHQNEVTSVEAGITAQNIDLRIRRHELRACFLIAYHFF